MARVEWDIVCPLKDIGAIEEIEAKYHYQLPTDLKECIRKNNAGMPSPSYLDLGDDVVVFGELLSFNKEDDDSIYDFIESFKDTKSGELIMFPFGVGPAGDFFCLKDGKIVFWDHEFDSTTIICDTFTQFLDMLYED